MSGHDVSRVRRASASTGQGSRCPFTNHSLHFPGSGTPLSLPAITYAIPLEAPDATPLPRLGGVLGFRQFLEGSADLSLSSTTLIDGEPPQATLSAETRFRQLMAELAARCRPNSDFTEPLGEDLKAWENPRIPAGYTYLLQLVAHDMVESDVSLAEMGDPLRASGNLRRHPLLLDTLYGGGPLNSPLAYEFVRGGSVRQKLRLGPMKDNHKKLRDVPRNPVFESNPDPLSRRPSEVMIADRRNDNNGIISQLLVAFGLFHNALIKRLSSIQFGQHADTRTEALIDQFICARALVTLVYREIVKGDVLPKILHPSIYEAYFKRNAPLLDTHAAGGDLRPTLEFAFAAFRFGHSMVRDEYTFTNVAHAANRHFNLADILEQSSDDGFALNAPPDASWIASWSRFFPIHGRPRPDFSRRLAPSSARGLNDAIAMKATDQTDQYGLEYRDLVSAGLARVWRVQPLVELIEAKAPGRLGGSILLSDPAFRKSAITDWLEARGDNSPAAKAKIAAIAMDPPLPFFVRFEAAWNHPYGGQTMHLGPLGSLIIAEAMTAAFSKTALPEEQIDQPLSIRMVRAVERIIGERGKAALQDILSGPEITSMPELLVRIATMHGGELDDPPFL